MRLGKTRIYLLKIKKIAKTKTIRSAAADPLHTKKRDRGQRRTDRGIGFSRKSIGINAQNIKKWDTNLIFSIFLLGDIEFDISGSGILSWQIFSPGSQKIRERASQQRKVHFCTKHLMKLTGKHRLPFKCSYCDREKENEIHLYRM